MAEAEATVQKTKGIQNLLLRNTALLMAAQLLATPLGVLINGAMGRYLGPEDFGYMFLASTFSTFGFLFVQWGQSGTLPAAVAKDRTQAGAVLGTTLAFQLVASVAVYAILALIASVLGYDLSFQKALVIVALTSAISTITLAIQDTIRGFERTDVAALGVVGGQFAIALLVVPTLMLGGRLYATLAAQAVAALLMMVVVGRALRTVELGRLSVHKETLVRLLKDGAPFFMLGLIMTLQPTIDAVILSKLAPAETVGWHAASRKLVGVLVMPAGALISALYPTLCRLHAEDRQAYVDTTRGALSSVSILVVPAAIGCAAYADIGVQLFSRAAFGPAGDLVRVLSLFILLVYFTMTLGAALIAAGLQRPWAITQLLCVIVSVVADPFLVPYTQARYGNGGIGVCIATVLSEVLMMVVGIWLAPPGLLNQKLLRQLGLALVGGAVMGGIAWVLRGISPYLSAPIATAGYFGTLWLTGALKKEQLGPLADFVARKLRRRRS